MRPTMDEEEHQSLEYEEDCYYSAPSFEPSWTDDEEAFCIAEEELCSVETEFRRKPDSVKVTFQDLSRPYLPRVSSPTNYRRFLQLVKAVEAPLDMSPDSGINELQGLTPEEQERQRKEWQDELSKVEEEIQTLRHVLSSKVKHSQELKRKLGISVWREFQEDMTQGIKNVKESNVYHNVEEKIGKIGRAVADAPIYQKTESVIKTTAEKTTSLLGGLGSSVSMKLGQLKNSDSFRSLEEKVGSAYENVKTKVVTSRSNSTQSFDEALKEADTARRTSNVTPATSPTIPEDKALS